MQILCCVYANIDFLETIFDKATRVKMVTKTSFCLDLFHVVKSIVQYLVTLCALSACSIIDIGYPAMVLIEGAHRKAVV